MMNPDMMTAPGRLRYRRLATDLAAKSTLMYVLGHLLDLLTTYLITPDLSREANPMVSRYDLGWTYILVSAGVTSVIMLAAQFWLWRRLLQRFPTGQTGYRGFYHRLLYGSEPGRAADTSSLMKGALMGVIGITAYAVITAKLLTALWNLLILIFGLHIDAFVATILLKNGVAATVGLFMFFGFPYLLYRRHT